MSFSSDIKTELCAVRISDCCKLPLAYGFLLFSRSFSVNGIKMQTETGAVAGFLSELISEVYSVDCTVKSGGGKRTVYRLEVENEADRLKLLASVDFGIYDGKINSEVFTHECCKQSFIRGAFLACGQISDPKKMFRVDMPVRDKALADELRNLLSENFIETNISQRKNGCLVYIKRNEMITNLLTFMGASGRSLELIEESILNSVKNNMNRARNCDSANLDRMVEASLNRRIAIEYLQKKGIISSLPDELIRTAKLRMDYPDASIKELCKLSDEPISPSGLNHRLKRIVEIYNQKTSG